MFSRDPLTFAQPYRAIFLTRLRAGLIQIRHYLTYRLPRAMTTTLQSYHCKQYHFLFSFMIDQSRPRRLAVQIAEVVERWGLEPEDELEDSPSHKTE